MFGDPITQGPPSPTHMGPYYRRTPIPHPHGGLTTIPLLTWGPCHTGTPIPHSHGDFTTGTPIPHPHEDLTTQGPPSPTHMVALLPSPYSHGDLTRGTPIPHPHGALTTQGPPSPTHMGTLPHRDPHPPPTWGPYHHPPLTWGPHYRGTPQSSTHIGTLPHRDPHPTTLNLLQIVWLTFNWNTFLCYYRPQRSCEGLFYRRLSTRGGGVCLSACWDTTPPQSRHPPSRSRHPQEQTHPPTHPGDGHCCGRYASYWNAFLFYWCLPLELLGRNRFDTVKCEPTITHGL